MTRTYAYVPKLAYFPNLLRDIRTQTSVLSRNSIMSRSKFVRDEIKFRHEVMVAKSSGREVTMHPNFDFGFAYIRSKHCS